MELNPNHAVVLFSGGQDSTTCLFWALEKFEKVYPLIISYKQRHSIEIAQAKIIAAFAATPFKVANLDLGIFAAGNALTDTGLEVDTFAGSEAQIPNTFVPGRNLLFLTLAGMYAWQTGSAHIVAGMSQADYAGYPDCREAFLQSAERSVGLALDRNLTLHTPLLHRTKAETWLMARDLGCLDVVIRDSHSCYNGVRTRQHPWGFGCSECPACLHRAKGYAEAFGV
ncbi:MAG: 7-cyano-7-deazaguanine synthase QueC [Bacteroidetes bacterium]|nr:7-cyano-7-deazaguanine synthase QueC [Bacteroidota bacterium]